MKYHIEKKNKQLLNSYTAQQIIYQIIFNQMINFIK